MASLLGQGRLLALQFYSRSHSNVDAAEDLVDELEVTGLPDLASHNSQVPGWLTGQSLEDRASSRNRVRSSRNHDAQLSFSCADKAS